MILGAGGHARVVGEAVVEQGCFELIGFISRVEAEDSVLGLPILGSDEFLSSGQWNHFLIGFGVPLERRIERFEYAIGCGLSPVHVSHPRATISRTAEIGLGTVVLANAVVNSGAVVGINAIVNSGAIVEHECVVGDHVHIAPGAVLLGDVKVGAKSLIGAASVVLPGLEIGEGASIGAGSVVTKSVASGQTVAGNPARVFRA